MKFLIVAILLATLIFFTPAASANPGEIVIGDADTVWSANLVAASADVIDASDAPPQTLAEAFVSQADTAWKTLLQSPALADTTPPTCIIQLWQQNATLQIDKIDAGQFFDIYVGSCTDDSGMTEVRFSTDDLQDGNPTGQWTEWYGWNTSSGDWNATTEVKAWSFATGGKKEVWAEVKDGGGNTAQCHANIWAHPGYAIIVAGQGGLTDRQWFGHSADNAYRALHNLGFDDEHIFYLNSQRQLEINGRDVVDLQASKGDFDYAINQIKLRIKDRPTPFVLYLVGHGGQGIFVFDPEREGIENVGDFGLRQMLEDMSLDPAFIAIWTCDAGGFITLDFSEDSISVEGRNRIIVTGAHEHDTLRMYDLARSSDRLWGNLNTGLNIREAFVRDVTQADVDHRLLDDNGDQEGNPANNLRSDGELAGRTIIGVPNTYELALVPWYQALIHSAGELRVYDSQNRVTGLFNGEVKEEIPDSIYDEENETVAIFSPSANYRYEVVGTSEGTYGLEVNSIKGADVISFTASDIPTTSRAVHDYTVDWDALSRSEKGVTIQVDSDGDGTFERTFASDGELTGNEFTPRSGCFIATAAYGTPMAEEIQILREFRDEYLLTNPLGQGFVDFYYKVSPPIAEFITEHPSLKPIVKAGLLPAVAMSTVVVNTTPAEQIAILGLLVLVSVVVTVWATRRRGRGPGYSPE